PARRERSWIYGCASIGPFLGPPFGHRHRSPVEHEALVGDAYERVPEKILVVAFREIVRPRMRAPALLAGEARDDHGVGELEQEAELESLGEVGVEHLPSVVDDDPLVALPQACDDLALELHLLLAPEDAEVLVHRGSERVADLPGPLALL